MHLLLLFLLSSGIVLASPNTLPDAVQKTIETHPTIQSQEARIKAAKHSIREQRATYFPTVDLVLGTGEEWTNNSTTRAREGNNDLSGLSRDEGTLTINQRLFDGFDTSSRVGAAQKRHKSAKKSLLSQAEELAFQAVEVYLNILRQAELIKITDESVYIHQSILKKIQRREEAGYDRKADVYQAQTRLSLAKTRRETQQGALDDSKAAYREIVSAEPEELTSAEFNEDWLGFLQVEEAMHTALQENPEIQTAIMTTKANQLDIITAKAAFFPTIQLELSGSENQNLSGVEGQDDSYVAALRLRYNLFRGGADYGRKQKAVEFYFQALADESEIKRRVREDIRRTWNAIQVAKNQVVEETEHLAVSERLVEVYDKQFYIGTRSLIALLDAEDERALAKASLKNQQYRLLFEKYRLLSRVGRLLTSLNVKIR